MSYRARASTLQEVIEESLQDPEFRAEWERTAPAHALALRLVGYRAEHGLSQTALARKLGVSRSVVFRMELGEELPSIDTLAKVAEALGVEIVVDIKPTGSRPIERSAAAANAGEADAHGAPLLLAVSAPSRSAAD